MNIASDRMEIICCLQVQENIKFSISRWEPGVAGKIPVAIRQVLTSSFELSSYFFDVRTSAASLKTFATSASDSTLLLQDPTGSW